MTESNLGLLRHSISLETERLVLNPILANQLDTLYQILIDPYVRRYLCDDKVLSLQEVEEMLTQSNKQFEAERSGLWLIETKQNPQVISQVIGVAGLWYFFDEPQPQLLYALLPQATKQGYATEAARRLLDYAYTELGYSDLVASCDLPNLASQRVAERLGMRQVETRVEQGLPTMFFRTSLPVHSTNP
jgi:[ribosomal protein S5]-alanine N-acetyltransferase